MRASYSRNTRTAEEQQRAGDNERGDDIEPVGISNAYPGDGETTRGRADNESQLHHGRVQRKRIDHLFTAHQAWNDCQARWNLQCGYPGGYPDDYNNN